MQRRSVHLESIENFDTSYRVMVATPAMLVSTLMIFNVLNLQVVSFAGDSAPETDQQMDERTEALFFPIPHGHERNRKRILESRVRKWLNVDPAKLHDPSIEALSSSLARVVAARELSEVIEEYQPDGGPYRSVEPEASSSPSRVHTFELMAALEATLLQSRPTVMKSKTRLGTPLTEIQKKTRLFSSRSQFRYSRALASTAIALAIPVGTLWLGIDLADFLSPESELLRSSILTFAFALAATLTEEQTSLLVAGNFWGHDLLRKFAQKFQVLAEQRYGELSPEARKQLDFRNIEATLRKGVCATLFRQSPKKLDRSRPRVRAEEGTDEPTDRSVEAEIRSERSKPTLIKD